MPTRLPTLSTLLLVTPVLFLAACGGGEPRSPSTDEASPAGATGQDTAAPESGVDPVVVAGRESAQALAQNLVGALRPAMDSLGAAGAVEFCETQAGPITDRVSEASGYGITVKRVTTRPRNPDNAPDSLDRAALDYFRARLSETGALPEEWVQDVDVGLHRYYKPLVMGEFCLQCHGAPDQLGPGVAQRLAELYPEDQATGYQAGDFRGLIRVEIRSEE